MDGVESKRLELSVYPMTDDLFVVEVGAIGTGTLERRRFGD